jgi:hypothetical protein
MEPASPLVHLTTVVGSFRGRVIEARLAAEGVTAQLEGLSEGPYPLPCEVDILVRADQLDIAREILLADAVDAAFDEMRTRPPRRRRRRRSRLRRRGAR